MVLKELVDVGVRLNDHAAVAHEFSGEADFRVGFGSGVGFVYCYIDTNTGFLWWNRGGFPDGRLRSAYNLYRLGWGLMLGQFALRLWLLEVRSCY